MNRVRVTPEQVDHYNKPGPRYTSYPTVPVWSHSFGESDYLAALAAVAARPEDTLSVYVHLPFCAERCAYCGCNGTVTRHARVVDSYLDRVEREIALVVPHLGGAAPGGATALGRRYAELPQRRADAPLGGHARRGLRH